MRISDWSADVCASVLCRIIGDVVIGPDVSIWYNCVLRADVNQIRVGARSNIQDGSVVHCDGPMPHRPQGFPTIIGEDVLIGHLAMVHGCTLADRAFVGLKATVMNGCRRSEEHTSELQSLMRISYAVFCLKKKKKQQQTKAML